MSVPHGDGAATPRRGVVRSKPCPSPFSASRFLFPRPWPSLPEVPQKPDSIPAATLAPDLQPEPQNPPLLVRSSERTTAESVYFHHKAAF